MTAQQIRELLETERFARWYHGRFEDYLTGELASLSAEEIENDIAKMFKTTEATAGRDPGGWEREYLRSQIPENHEMGQ